MRADRLVQRVFRQQPDNGPALPTSIVRFIRFKDVKMRRRGKGGGGSLVGGVLLLLLLSLLYYKKKGGR